MSNKSITLHRDLKIINQYGMHARPAALFVKTAASFESEITVEKGGNKVSGKSIMGMMTLEASKGSILKITVTGPDAQELVDALQTLVDRKFDED